MLSGQQRRIEPADAAPYHDIVVSVHLLSLNRKDGAEAGI
jgi:hypothetical protein